MEALPSLKAEELRATRDYLQDTAKVLGALQRSFLPKSEHDWHYGLEVTLRGISTQPFELDGQPQRALIDLVRHKVRFMGRNWSLSSTPPAELFNELEAMAGRELKDPKLTAGLLNYDPAQADKYAASLWWMERQFAAIKAELKGASASPILLYPHHFDLALSWFPRGGEQLSIGWSTGDENIAEPYVYITSYPDPHKLKAAALPPGARWQTEGFNGVVFLQSGLDTGDAVFLRRAIEVLKKALV